MLAGAPKRWVLFPPHAIPPGVAAPAGICEHLAAGGEHEAARRCVGMREEDRYLLYTYYPAPVNGPARWFEDIGSRGLPDGLQCTVGVGELMVVPSGWWY